MKFGLFLTIVFIMSINITSNINLKNENISPHPFNFDIEGATTQDSIFEIIRSTNGNIFTHMRSVKQGFHPDIQHAFEKSIKDYEYRYISDKEDFVRFMFDRYQEMEYFEKNNKKETEDKYKEETFAFLKDIIKLYHNFNEKEKKEFLKFVEKQDKFTRDILEFGIKHHIAFDDSRFKDLGAIVRTIPEMLFGNQNLNKIKNIKGKINMKGQEIIIPKNDTKSTNKMKKSTEPIIQKNEEKNFLNQENNYLKNSTKLNETIKQKDFSFKTPEMNISHNFSKFINSVTNEYNLTHLHNQEHPTELKKLIFENLSNNMKDHHKKSFSIFLQEYIKESAYNSDMSLVTQYNSHNEEYFNDYDLSRFKSENRQDDPPPQAPAASTDTMKGGTEVSTKIKGSLVAKDKVDDIKRNERIAQFGKQPTCDTEKKAEEVKQLLTAKAEEIKKKTAGFKFNLSQIPLDLLKLGGDFSSMEGILQMIIVKFVGKMAMMAVSQIPFYFFKFCLPPGPLTFGCCPEASFFPTQIYNLFTVFDKVDKFKTVARNFPDWLQSINNQWFPEPLYYICLQGYLTMHESALFNICDPKSLAMTQLTLMGLLPGDLPVCFVSCIQAMVTCLTPPWNLGPCDAQINIFNLIAAIFDISARFRLMGSFIGSCSYIPFLIRWDLVVDWKPANKAHYDDPLATNVVEPNCEIPQEDPKSPYEDDLPADLVNQIKASVPPMFTPPPKGERGFRTKKSSFNPVQVDIHEEAHIGALLQTDTPELYDNPLYSTEFVDMVSQNTEFTSQKRLKRFPFHIKTYFIEWYY